jgi:hypothetical protein
MPALDTGRGHMKNMKVTTAIALGAAFSLAAATTAPAVAQEAPPTAAEAVAAVSPGGSGVIPAPTLSGDLEAEIDGSTILIPASSDGAVAIVGAESTLSVSLPAGLDVSEPSVSPDGSVVYNAIDPSSASLVVQAREDGSVSIQTVLGSPDAPLSYTYTVGKDLTLQSTDDGGIDLLADTDTGSITVGHIKSPWAFDAQGIAVDTHYTVGETTFTQVIKPTDHANYPIVADPTYGHSYLIPTAYLNKKETKSAGDLTGLTVICAAIGLFAAPLGVLCAANTTTLSSSARKINANRKCMKILLGPLVVAGLEYTGGNCK